MRLAEQVSRKAGLGEVKWHYFQVPIHVPFDYPFLGFNYDPCTLNP